MTKKQQMAIDFIKNNEILSDTEKDFWLSIFPSFNETQQDEFYKIISRGVKDYEILKSKQKKETSTLRSKQAKEWTNLVQEETIKTDKLVKTRIKEIDEEKIKMVLNKLK